ncbi:hypothetical protein CO046_00435 [Candidatus Peregrinibacteria bacterium CG_4_9_14_0_2_um_filter_53_11]|nr:MAG: hypothetical protein CO046_00435 [Candidatus Peregrinibacteria bacterium CG_4_9_14_0_2_um_filter_53_11]
MNLIRTIATTILKKLSRRGVVVSALVLVLVLLPNLVFAQADPKFNELLNDMNTYFNFALRFVSAWLWPILLMIGSLLDNELIFGGVMGERLLGLWVEMRNLVNILFVLILLAIAVYNVLGLGEDGGGLPLAFKTAIPKFVMALIVVNFSFIGIRVVLDFTNVITGAVFALPARSIDTPQKFQKDLETQICALKSAEVPLQSMWCDKDSEFNERAKQFFSRLDRSNIAVVYAIKFGKAIQLKFIRNGIQDISQLGFNIIFNAVIFVVYALSFIALFLVLLFRLVVMWIAVVLSPFLALTIVLPNLKSLAGEGGDIQSKFVQSLVTPITIGLVMSIGYIMLDAFAADSTIKGDILSSSSLTAVDINALPTGIQDLQQLMVAIGSVAIVWVGVFSAASKTFAGTITEVIRERAVSFGKFVAKLPTYAQVIPVGTKGSVSPAQVFATLSDIPAQFKQARGLSYYQTGNREELNRFRTGVTGSVQQLGKTLAELPHQLQNPAGWLAFKDSVVSNRLVKDGAEFDRKFGSHDANAYQTAARVIYNDSQLRPLQAELQRNGIRNQNAFIAAVQNGQAAAQAAAAPAAGGATAAAAGTAPAPVAATSQAVLDEIQSKTPAQLAAVPAFQGWTPAEIVEFKTALATIRDRNLREKFIVIRPDGAAENVVKSGKFTGEKATAAQNLAGAIKAEAEKSTGKDIEKLKTDLTTALTTGGLSQTHAQIVINHSSLDTVDKRALIATLSPTP